MLNNGINSLLVTAANDINKAGVERYNERTQMKIKELLDYVMFGNPNYRYITLENRKNNFCAQIVEMMMVLSGNPDLKYLSMFLKRAVDYSDDNGLTWRGNYGIRLRGCNKFKGENNKSFQFARYQRDNLEMIINTLANDPTSRQAFVTIGDSNLDRFIKTKDTPCTMTLVFRVTQDNLLNMTTLMRSNDIIFGFSGVNYFIFTCLQELISCIIGTGLGRYCHHPVSFHVYENYYDNLSKIGSETPKEVSLTNGIFTGFTSLEQFDKLAYVYFTQLLGGTEPAEVSDYKNILLQLCPNRNLAYMLLSTICYHFELNGNDFYTCISDGDKNLIELFKRDLFFNKHVHIN